MGCDVHGFTEVKIKGEWHSYSALNIDRHYALFERLAGVRGCVSKAIDNPRGAPANPAIVTRMELDSWGPDGHTVSWLDNQEMTELQKYAEQRLGYKCWERIFGYINGHDWDSLPEYIEEARVIFWFDN